MTDVPVIAGRKHLSHVPYFEVQAGRRIQGYDRPERIELIADELERRGGYSLHSPAEHGLGPVGVVHEADMVEFLRAASAAADEGPEGLLFADTFMHRDLRNALSGDQPVLGLQGSLGRYCFDTITAVGPGTFAAALEAADCALTAAEHLDADRSLAVALTRPAGHHASASLFGGGTFLNNAAVAVEFLRARGRERVGLLDLDVHHGNGSQSVFYERPEVFVVNLHADPVEHFPFFVGFEAERGAGAGEGRNLNLVLASRIGIEEYLRRLDTALDALAEFAADALVVSLGVDGHERDPVQAGALTPEDFRRIGARVGELGLSTLVVLEGGYASAAVGASVGNWLDGFVSNHAPSQKRRTRSVGTRG